MFCFLANEKTTSIDLLKIEIEAIRRLIEQRSKDGEATVLYIGKLLGLSSVLEKLTLATRNGKAPTITSLGGRVGIWLGGYNVILLVIAAELGTSEVSIYYVVRTMSASMEQYHALYVKFFSRFDFHKGK